MIGYSKAKLYGQPYRGGYEGEGTGGGFSGGEGGGFGGFGGSTFSDRSDLAEMNAPGASLTGGNFATGGIGFGVDSGPVTAAAGQAWADGLAGANPPADSVIVTPAAPKTSTVGTVLQTGLNILSAVLQIASGNPPAVVNGLRSGVSMMSDAFAGSPAPSVFAGNDSGEGTGAPTGAQFGGADTGGMARDAVEGVGGSPVLGFGGVVIGAPQTTTTSGGALALPAGLAALFAPPGNTRQLYGTVEQQQPAAPAISPALALAGLAGLIFLG